MTRGKWSVARIEGIDAKGQTIYYTSTEASPLQRQLYSVQFDGSNQRRITTAEGKHRINMSPNAKYFIDRYSSLKQPTAGGALDRGGPASCGRWRTTRR